MGRASFARPARRTLLALPALVALLALLVATGLSAGCSAPRETSEPTGSPTGAPTSGSTVTPASAALSSDDLLESLSTAIKNTFK